MAFKDIQKYLYPNADGEPTIKLDYKDKAHRYYAYPRIDFSLPVTDKKAWGKNLYPKGTTTLIGDTLEKKGLMTWPLGLAMRELFGFYDFDSDNGRMTGFSKGVGTLWEDGKLLSLDQETLLPLVTSASKAWQRRQQKGADIGSVVHDAIEHYIKGLPFDIAEQYMWNIKDATMDDDTAFQLALEEFEADTKMANLAFEQFTKWWDETAPVLHAAEDLLYSKENNVCGTFDGDISIHREHHPVFNTQPLYRWKSGRRLADGEQKERYESDSKLIRCTTDWKTSNASKSKSAAMPEGVNYQYFTQSAIYEMIRREMGFEPADDLLVVSVRKDGGFSLVYASELGLTVDECIEAAKATILCHRFMDKTKKALLAHAEEAEVLPAGIINPTKEAF